MSNLSIAAFTCAGRGETQSDKDKQAGETAAGRTTSRAPRVQVAFRMEKLAYVELKRLALEQATTVNELLNRAVRNLRDAHEASSSAQGAPTVPNRDDK